MDVFNLAELNFSIVSLGRDDDSVKDSSVPFSFLDFIKYLQVSYDPSKYSILYSRYLKEWYAIKDSDVASQTQRYNEFYKQFIQEIIINFATETEKRFLSKIDYNNPTDLDVVIPFYANKLTEVATFYKNKREAGKYVVDTNKIRGSVIGVERAIFDNIYNYVINSEDALLTYGGSLSGVIQDFGININEYVDVYGDYFDLYRSDTAEVDLREKLYSNNLQDINVDFYFDPDALKVLRDTSFVGSIADFKINPPDFDTQDIASVCNPDDSILDELENVYTKGGLTLAQVYTLKRQLISKYISSDFYYIDTTGTTPTSGVLFEAEQPTNNLLNLQTADIAAVQSNSQKLLKDVGLFFKPDDIGIFKLNAGQSVYEIDTSNLESNKVYIFPDPNIYGNVGVNSLSSYPVVLSYDFRKNIRNISSGTAVGDPYITNKALTFEPYSTKQREIQELEKLNTLGYRLNFSDLANQGKIRKMGYDSFGNEYALFKPAKLRDREVTVTDFISNKLLDGHTFYDNVFGEGYNFDYDITACDPLTNTFRSGLSTFTSLYSGNEWQFDYGESSPSFFNFRRLTPYEELAGERTCGVNEFVQDGGLFTNTTGSAQIVGTIKDGGGFTQGDGSPLPEPYKPDDPQYPGLGNYYYQTFVDCLSFGNEIRDEYNCGRYTDIIVATNQENFTSKYEYYNVLNDNNRTVLAVNDTESEPETIIERLQQTGALFVKTEGTSLSYPVTAVLGNVINKYSKSICEDISSNLKDFEVINNSIFLQTPNGLLIDKISYTNGVFGKPNTANTFLPITNSDPFSEVSNKLVVKKGTDTNIFFTIFKPVNRELTLKKKALPKNYWYVYPEIYQYNQSTNETTLVYPQSPDQDDLVSFKTSFDDNSYKPTVNFAPERLITPKLVYNSTNNKFKLTYVILDQNNLSHIHDCTFAWRGGELSLLSVIRYTPADSILRTSTFSIDETDFADIYKNSGGYEVDGAFWLKGIPRSQLNSTVFSNEELNKVFSDQESDDTYYKPEYL